MSEEFAWQSILDITLAHQAEDDVYLKYVRSILQNKIDLIDLILSSPEFRKEIKEDPRTIKINENEKISQKIGIEIHR